jgi:pimeloyl-ACP methyl ester carboxylesterase
VILLSKTYWGGPPFHFRQAPAADVEPVLVRTTDHRHLSGLFWSPRAKKARVGVLAIHPRVDFARHYAFVGLLEAGVACLGLRSRCLNDDKDCVHEELIRDVAAGIGLLKERGLEVVVLLGNSGGGSLAALYQEQALAEPGARSMRTPAGRSTRLDQEDLPKADAMIYLAAHPGQGRVLGRCIDPAVVDEADPLQSDADLDMYLPANGFAEPPSWSSYDGSFVERFREAQERRVSRLDEVAREMIAEGRRAAQATKADDYSERSPDERRALERRKAFQPVMVIYRTMANLDYVDPSLDPSARDYGSLLSDRPDLMNWQLLGFGRICTPRAWLSTWSARSSVADMARTLPAVSTPSLMVHAGADREIHPAAQRQMSEALASDDSTVITVEGARHYFEPDFGQSDAPHRDQLADILARWLRERFEL